MVTPPVRKHSEPVTPRRRILIASSPMRSLAPLATMLLASCPTSQSALVGCAKDVDCKGARICERGSCVDPPAPGRGKVTDGGVPPAPPTLSDLPDGASQQGDAAPQQTAPPPSG